MRFISLCRLPAAALLLPLVAACSSTTNNGDVASDSGSESGIAGDATTMPNALDGASCTVVVFDYDSACDADTDCTLVPRGGNICNPCDDTTGAHFCDFSALSKAGSVAYLRALHADDPDAEAPEGPNDSCRTGSCPAVQIHASCTAGKCVSDACEATGGHCVQLADAGFDAAADIDNPYPCNVQGEVCVDGP